MRGWEKIFNVNRNEKKAGIATLLSDKENFEKKTVISDKEGYFIMIKGEIK